eukprot:gene3030-5940_t
MTIQLRITSFASSFCLTSGILLVSGFLCILPVFLDLKLYPSIEPDSALSLSFESLYYTYALIASISVSVPMLIDYAMDVISGNKESRSLGIASHRDLVLTLLLPDGILLWIILPTKNYAYFPCLLNARELFFLYAFLNRMKINLPQAWTVKATAPLAFVFSTWKLFSVYTAFVGELNLSTITTMTYFFQFLSVFILILLYIRGYYMTLNNGADQKLLYRYILPYKLSFLLVWLGIIFIGLESGSTIWIQTNTFHCISYTLTVGLFGSFVSVLNSRMIRSNAKESEVHRDGDGDNINIDQLSSRSQLMSFRINVSAQISPIRPDLRINFVGDNNDNNNHRYDINISTNGRNDNKDIDIENTNVDNDRYTVDEKPRELFQCNSALSPSGFVTNPHNRTRRSHGGSRHSDGGDDGGSSDNELGHKIDKHIDHPAPQHTHSNPSSSP